MQGAAHTATISATTSATIKPRTLQQWQQYGKSREPAIDFIMRFIRLLEYSLENSVF